MNRVCITDNRNQKLQDIGLGQFFVDRTYRPQVYLKTAETRNGWIVCVDMRDGRMLCLDPHVEFEAVRDHVFHGNKTTKIDDVSAAKIGSILKFDGYPGETFIKAARAGEIKYYSTETGVGVTDQDKELSGLPATIYDTELEVVL